MFVIAFDGVLFDTLDARALALHDALVAEGVSVAVQTARDAIGGRTFHEAIQFVTRLAATNDPVATPAEIAPDVALHVTATTVASAIDATSIDIASLRAGQAFASLATRGFALNVHARELLLRAAAVTRIVVRADSRRREVEALLALSGLENVVSMSRCCDDPAPRLRDRDDAFSHTLRQSYASIMQRLNSNQSLLGERNPVGISLEACALGRSTSASHGFDAADSVSAVRFPRT